MQRPLELDLEDALRAAYPAHAHAVEVLEVNGMSDGALVHATLKVGDIARILVEGHGPLILVWPKGDTNSLTHHTDIPSAVAAVGVILATPQP